MNDLGAVVSVPTPTVDGLCDDSIVREVLEELGDTPVLLKSTVLPDIVETYADNVVYSPEFLRTAEEDFDNQEVCYSSAAARQIHTTLRNSMSYPLFAVVAEPG